MSDRPLEYCGVCGEQTGKAGASDGSLYCEYCKSGPFCEDCWAGHACIQSAEFAARQTLNELENESDLCRPAAKGRGMSKFIPAEAFPVAEYIEEEMEARGWSRLAFAQQAGLLLCRVDELLSPNLNRRITRLEAYCIGKAFGSDPQVWLNLDASYWAWREANPQKQ